MQMHGVALVFILGFTQLSCSSASSPIDSNSLSNDPTQPPNEGRLERTSRPVSISLDRSAESDESLSLDFETTDHLEFVQIAQLSPPELNGRHLQATRLAVSNNELWVAYGYQGPEQIGGIDQVEISNPENLRLNQQIIFKDREVNALSVSGKDLYFAGATANEQEGPAYIGKISFDDHQVSQPKFVKLDGFNATDLVSNQKRIWVTVGDRSGLFELDTESFRILDSRFLFDARALSLDDDTLSVLTGAPAQLYRYSLHDFDPERPSLGEDQRPLQIGGAETRESKSSLQSTEGYWIATQGEAGLSIICKSSPATRIQVPVNRFASVLDDDQVTNSASLDGSYLYAANGGAGVSVYRTKLHSSEKKCISARPVLLGQLQFEAPLSANEIVSYKNYLIVASGIGGVRILKKNEARH